MYTGKVLPPMRAVVQGAEWAAGFLHVCRQSALDFGSDRKIPAAARPVVEIRKDGSRVVVLPCTSQDRSSNPEFLELASPGKVMWTRPYSLRTFVFRRYEAVANDALLEKIGVMPHPARIQLLQWLKDRY